MNDNPVSIRPAVITDLPDLLAMYGDAAKWLRDNGSDQWATALIGDQLAPQVESRYRAAVEAGECFVAIHAGAVVGSFILDKDADPEFWSAEDEPEAALYLHRMVVAQSARGHDLGGRMIEWAAQAAAAQGKKWLRLDAWATNEKLHQYYLDHGFQLVRHLRFDHRGSGALFGLVV